MDLDKTKSTNVAEQPVKGRRNLRIGVAHIGTVARIGMGIFLGENGISNKLGNPSSKVWRPDR